MAFLELKNVSKSFVSSRSRSTSLAVRDFDLEIAPGEFFCLLGPSGCGKSTVLTMLAGFEHPTGGEIRVNGQPVEGPSKDRCVVFQGDDSLYPWLTAAHNVEFGLRMAGMPSAERRQKVEAALGLVGLSGQGSKFPAELSGGMRQRIQIARALVIQPKVLLMDEPFGALDAQTRHVMQHELRKIWLATKSTVVFITHDIDEAILLGTRVGVMTAGPGGTLRDVVTINIEGERDRLDPAYTRYYAEVHGMIRDEVAKSVRAMAA
ncbi:ABC transporter ATP-binding protein [Enterovirga aerilata]|uniref:ABC transporter ATP-binding protein n=1 Tax=Enterovirga aerilata TaxID=2730920 RepID=A0A849I0N1_9HYPH|nr:ABC transporter ATP-binding protein [Enterovirga sp. DB1703]NNM70878.1 ABC transporter ATP-binding protein [Enterovirga sp. DB1703]